MSENVGSKRLTVDGRPLTVIEAIRRVELVEIDDNEVRKPLAGTFLRWCPTCGQMTPHQRLETGSTCVVCR